MGKERIDSSKKRERQSKSKCTSEEETECVCVCVFVWLVHFMCRYLWKVQATAKGCER